MRRPNETAGRRSLLLTSPCTPVRHEHGQTATDNRGKKLNFPGTFPGMADLLVPNSSRFMNDGQWSLLLFEILHPIYSLIGTTVCKSILKALLAAFFVQKKKCFLFSSYEPRTLVLHHLAEESPSDVVRA